MTHYDIDYSKMSEPEKSNRAIQDIKDFQGEEWFDHLTKLFKKELPDGPSLEQFSFMCSFLGVQGYPVKAWYNLIWPL